MSIWLKFFGYRPGCFVQRQTPTQTLTWKLEKRRVCMHFPPRACAGQNRCVALVLFTAFWSSKIVHPLAPKQAMAAVKNPSEKGGTRWFSPVTYLLQCTHIAIQQGLLPLLLFLQQASLSQVTDCFSGPDGKSQSTQNIFWFSNWSNNWRPRGACRILYKHLIAIKIAIPCFAKAFLYAESTKNLEMGFF